MLKVRAKGAKTELLFHTRESRFSPDFFRGLGWAIGAHALFFFYFRIASPPSQDLSSLLPFTEVVAEWVVEASAFPMALKTPELSLNEMEPLFLVDWEPRSPFAIQERFREEPDFSSLEKIPYHSTMDDL